MKNCILFILIWWNFINEFTIAIYKAVEDNLVEVSAMGKVNIQYTLEYGSYLIGKWWACDQGSMWPYYMCDPKILYYAVSGGFVKVEDVGALFADIRYYIKQNPYYVKNSKNWVERGLDVTDYSLFLTVDVYTFSVWDLKYLSSTMFYKIVGICANAKDVNFIVPDLYYGSDCIFQYVINNNEFIRYKFDLRDNSFIQFAVKTICQSNYFEPTCWKQCENSTIRFYCDANGNEICIGNFEPITYRFIYLMVSQVYVSWGYEIKYIDMCKFVNLCYDKTTKSDFDCKNNSQLCFPIRNASKSCASFHHKYIVPHFPDDFNMTFQSLLNTENIHFVFLFKGETTELLWNQSTCTWTYPYNKYYLPFSVLKNGSHLTYPIHIAYGTYSFTIECVLAQYRTLIFYRILTIHVIPTEFKIFNVSLGNDEILFIGQTVRCESNAVPQNISIHLIFFLSDNFKKKLNSFTELYIPITSITGPCLIECIHFFKYVDGRPPENISALLNFEIKSYVYFKWKNPFKNQYAIDETTGCLYLVYFGSYIVVTVLEGQSELKTSPYDNFTLQVSRGGKYVLLCRLSDDEDNIYFIKSKTIEISFEPSLFCLMPYFATPGSIITFAHNGYPPDEANIAVSIYVNGEEVSFTRVTYIKIPYEVNSKKLLMLGKITFTLKNKRKVLQIKREITFLQETNRIISITHNDQECADFSEYETRYNQLSDNILMFNAEILELQIPTHFWIELLYCFYLLPLFGMVFIIYVTKRIKTIRTIETRRKAIKFRYLNDHMAHNARKSAGPEVVFSEQFTRLRTMQTYSDESNV